MTPIPFPDEPDAEVIRDLIEAFGSLHRHDFADSLAEVPLIGIARACVAELLRRRECVPADADLMEVQRLDAFRSALDMPPREMPHPGGLAGELVEITAEAWRRQEVRAL